MCQTELSALSVSALLTPVFSFRPHGLCPWLDPQSVTRIVACLDLGRSGLLWWGGLGTRRSVWVRVLACAARWAGKSFGGVGTLASKSKCHSKPPK